MIQRRRSPGKPPQDIDHGPGRGRCKPSRYTAGSGVGQMTQYPDLGGMYLLSPESRRKKGDG